ncbi:MAG: MtrB/PioB family outer membrane beta-barrel protein, partial [Desulfuromonadales bacterium]|nr:MtrB/PioB family outer membrane beta-barrel protein [Desulfuromonadales bacterium]NIS43829.1 MtrB/PioB family outer membrane beta-barrel protein [Desulfuromonadales bacterium]
NAEFKIQHRELKGKVEVPVPAIPGLTLDVGYRHQEREGTEQAINMSKCAGCHITGESRRVDEVTQDVSAGATGKFGLLTLRYEFTDRKFINRAAPSLYQYDPVQKPGQPFDNTIFENRMGYDYEDGAIPYGVDPDSEKQSHVVKARVDLPKEATVVGSYVKADIESAKGDGANFVVDRDKLQTTYDGYGLKASMRFGRDLKVNLRGRAEELESDSPDVSYTPLTSGGGAGLTGPVSYEQEPLETVISRDVATIGLDAVYRLARKTTLRLGAEYEEVDREDEHFDATDTLTIKGNLNTRFGRDLSARLALTYQDIDNPFHNPTAADVPLSDNNVQSTEGIDAFKVGSDSLLYGTSFYAAREADLTNQPDSVYEGKLSSTWSPSPRFSATFNYRYKDEEAELNKYTWEQETHAPGLSLWVAPADKLFLTLAANYLDQRSETAFCQGFYDG